MMSMNLISHICFLVSLLFFVISGVVFLTMDVYRGWHILSGKPMKYSEEQRQKDKIRRKNKEAKQIKNDISTAELTVKIHTNELNKQPQNELTTVLSMNKDDEATTVLGENIEERTTVLNEERGEEATTVLGQDKTTVLRSALMEEETTILGGSMSNDETTVLMGHHEEQETTILSERLERASDFKIVYEITQCSISE